MNTRQHNLNPVERTFWASGLLGRPDQQKRTDRGYLDTSSVLGWASTAAMFGLSGLSVVIPNFGQIHPIA